MTIIHKDITDVEKGYILHCVNCMGAMNSGVAKAIRDKWPIVYKSYATFTFNVEHTWDLLGKCLTVPVADQLTVCNIFGQYDYGKFPKKYVEYAALKMAFQEFSEKVEKENISPDSIYFPYGFACGLAGGDWSGVVYPMIKKYFPKAILCRI